MADCICLFVWYLFLTLAFDSAQKKELTYVGITGVSVSAVVSILYAFCVTYIQFPPNYEYMCYQPNFPSGNLSVFLKYALQPTIVVTVCFTLFRISRYRMNRKG